MRRSSIALIIGLFMVGMAVNPVFASPPPWEKPKNMQYSMIIHARIQVDGQFIEADGSKLATFKNAKCRGVEAVQQGPLEKWFQLGVASNKTAESDFVLKVYDAASDQVYCVQEAFNFVIDQTIGLINTPQIYTAVACSEIGVTLRISPEIVYLDHDAAGQTFDINIAIEDAADLGAFQFNLNYNSAIVGIERNSHVALGAFLESTGRTADKFIEIDDEKLNFVAITSGENAGPEGEGILGKITFTVKDLPATDSTLSLGDVEFTNAGGPPFSVLPVDEITGAVIKKTIIPTHTITASVEGHGNMNPSGSITVPRGESRSFSILPDGCYHIENVQADNVSVGAVNSYTFGNINDDHTINAVFAADTHIIGASAGDNGTISPSGNVLLNCGSNQIFTVTPEDECHRIEDVLVNDVSVGPVSSYEFENVTGNHTIAAVFAIKQCTVTPISGTGGSISPSEPVTVDCGSDRIFSMTPDECHDMEDVMENGESGGTMNPYTFECGDTGSYTMEPAFTPAPPCVIEAVAGDGGSIEPSGTVTADCGSNETFAITPDESRYILDVKVDGESVGSVSSYTFECDGADIEMHRIEADFTSCLCKVEVSAGEGGSISPSGSVSAACGSERIFTIIPDECYETKDVIVDDESKGVIDFYTFKCDDGIGSHTMKAVFAIKTCTVEVSENNNGGGKISPSGDMSLNCGTERIFTIIPDECYETEDVMVDYESKGSVASYMLQCDETETHKMTSTFIRKVAYGDVNQDNDVDLKDAILAFRVLVGAITPSLTFQKEDDINGDGKIGMEEAIYILQGMLINDNSPGNLADVILILNLISGRDIGADKELTVCSDTNGDRKIGMEEIIYILSVML